MCFYGNGEMVNGSPSGEFQLERGVRQGDPLSPFLFLIVAEGLNILVKRAVEMGGLQPVEVGRDKIRISHLQYADDTLFIAESSLENAKSIKWILGIFELMSGLSVNFDKCRVVGLNMEDGEVEDLALVFGCQTGELPMNYLGTKVGGGVNNNSSWEGVFEKARRRLGGWESKLLSMGGRLSLINFVLTAIPIYRMSMHLMPAGTVKKIRSIQCGFFWGKGELDKKKIAWVKWDNICKQKREGGLGVKNLKWLNLALVGKWMWRFINESNSLWVRIIKSRLEPSFNLRNCSRRSGALKCQSGWWKKVITAIDGSNGNWFLPNLKKEIGNGLDTDFWEDPWLGDGALKAKFPRLYNLSLNKKAKVGEVGKWSNGRWIWEWEWRRPLLEREISLGEELKGVTVGVLLKQGVSDKWKWGAGGDGNFSVRKAYEEIAKLQNPSVEVAREARKCRFVWKTIAPLKQQVMAWRAIWNRLPTKDNLHRRFELSAEERQCVYCGWIPESARHLFLNCKEVDGIWNKMMGWIGIQWSAPKEIGDHFFAFSRLMKGKNWVKKLGGLWICVIWVVWRWRNKKIFQNEQWDTKKMEEEIKCRFWSWCLVKGYAEPGMSFLTWSRETLTKSWD